MNQRKPLDDGALRAMLEERAGRATLDRPDVRAIVAAAGPRARRPLLGGGGGPRLAWAGGAVAVALVAVVLVAQPLLPSHGANPTASALPSADVPASAAATPVPTTRPALTPLQLLTPAEAGAVIPTASAAHSGALIAVQGRLETASTGRCATTVDVPSQSTTCGPTILADAGVTVTVRPVGDVGPGPWDGSGPLEGALILRLDPRIENGVHGADFVGLLTTPSGGRPSWFVQDILEGSVNQDGAYAAVQGWLVRDGFHPCPSDPRNPPVSYGCPTDDWLSEDEFQPLQPDGSSLGPPAAIDLSSGSYDRWAPNPAVGGPGGGGVEPREATYLMRLVSDGCGPNADCLPPPPRWRIVGRFDPIVDASEGATPSPSVDPQSDVLTVAGLLEQRPSGSADYRVRGWLEASFAAARCAAPIKPTPSGWPRHDCGRFDWLTDTPFRPSPAWESPPVGMLAQSGAYDAFAIDPVWKDQIAEPSFGTYIVRVAVHSTCEALPASSTTVCGGGPFWAQEIVGRDDSVTTPPGTAASPDPVVATDGRVPPPNGDAWTVAQLRDRPMPGDGTFLLRGWLVATPALRCLEELPRPSGEPDYGCSEADWLTDEAFQPWVSNASGGGTREPRIGIRVQNGAYSSFAPSPAGVAGGGLEPRFGTFVVRETTRGRPCPFGNACAIPTTHWEVIARLP